ncbi:MAG: response regulator [Chloroflexota bacterium]
MKNIEILVVEDESIVALDIQQRLRKLGYTVPVLAASGDEAIQLAAARRPNLVLMDIRLKGTLDGVETARQIQAELDIPAIYLTAYADEVTLSRAKITAPYGYILKPFEERELHTAIEMALYKHQLEKELKESRKWLATTLNSIAEAVIATDAQGRVKLMNPIAEALTGWQQTEAFGRELPQIFQILNEDTLTPAQNPVMHILRCSDYVAPATHLLITRAGEEIPIDDHAAPIRDDKEKIIGVVLTFRDITKERAIQQRIQDQEKLAAIGQLAGGIAHEFNNILTSIIGFAELANSRLNEPGILKTDLNHIIVQGQRAAHLVRQILDFSRKSIIQKRLLELTPFLEETIILLKHTLAENIQVSLEIEPGCEFYKIEADPAQIQQALTNVVANAQDAMPEGGRLQFRLSRLPMLPGESPSFSGPEPAEARREAVAWIALTISDTGVGIKPENFSRLFEPFYTTKEVGQGAGLGLAQVYGIIQQHGGNIEVASQVGQGTTFTFHLPVHAVIAKPAPQEIPPKLARGQGERVLLVDDEPMVMEMAQSMLEYLGYQVLTATNDRQAMEIFDRQPDDIALILVDVVVPAVGGMALANVLAQRNSRVKVIALTEYPPEPAVKGTCPPSIVDWLQKPWSLEKLAQTVKRALS